jgi:hypothetical protein
VGGRVGGRVGGWVTIPIMMPLRGPSCKLRLFRFPAKLKFQDGPSVAKIASERDGLYLSMQVMLF